MLPGRPQILKLSLQIRIQLIMSWKETRMRKKSNGWTNNNKKQVSQYLYPLCKWKLTFPVTKFCPKNVFTADQKCQRILRSFRKMDVHLRSFCKMDVHFPAKFSEILFAKSDNWKEIWPINLPKRNIWKEGHSFTRGVKMWPIFAAYLLIPQVNWEHSSSPPGFSLQLVVYLHLLGSILCAFILT